MKVHPSDSRSVLRPYREHVVEIKIPKDQLTRSGFSLFPALCAMAIQPLPNMAAAGDAVLFRFHLEDWNNVVSDFLEDRDISFDNFHVLTEERDRAKGIRRL